VVTAAIMVVAVQAGRLAPHVGLTGPVTSTKIDNGDGSFTLILRYPALEMGIVACLVAIPLLLLAASRLKVNPLDALALRLPSRPGRVLLILVVLLLLEYGLRAGQVAFWTVWEAAGGTFPLQRGGAVIRREDLIASIALFSVLGPVAEELAFRGMLLQSLVKTRLGFWGAAILSSLPFAAFHVCFGFVVGALWFGLTGMVLALALRQTGSLWSSIGLHIAMNSAAVAVLHARA
jgi:membrane protease YdiL (CAAX protease family)